MGRLGRDVELEGDYRRADLLVCCSFLFDLGLFLGLPDFQTQRLIPMQLADKTILILDSSQIQAFGECPTLWYYAYQRHLQKNPPPGWSGSQNVPMDMGTYGHKLLEIIYKERSKGNYSGALDLAFAYDIDKETCRCSHGAEKHKPLCESVGCPCAEFVPVQFPLSLPDREFVKNRVLEYTMVEGPVIPELKALDPEHVEVGFSYNLYEDDKRLYILEGRIDLLGQIANNCPEGWADHKFQSRERDLYLKSIQFRNYAMVTELAIGVVNYIRFAKKVEKDKTFKRSIISFSRLEMSSWKDNLIRKYNQIEQALLCDDWYDPNDNWRERSSCAGKFGYPCEFTKLCEEYTNPALIRIYEQSEYQKKAEWRPW